MIHRAIPSFLLAALLLTGCSTIQSAISSMSTPTAEIADVRIVSLSTDSVTLGFDVKISNPYSLDLPLANLGYALSTGSSTFLTGDAKLQGSVPANGSKTVTVPTVLKFADLYHISSNITPGSVVPYKAALKLSADIPGGKSLSLPLETEGKLPIPTTPGVQVVDFKPGALSVDSVSAVLHLKLTNKNQFAFDLANLGVNLSIADTPIAKISTATPTHFDAGQAQTLEIPLSFSPVKLGWNAIGILKNPNTKFSVDGVMDGQTPFGPLNLPYHSEITN